MLPRVMSPNRREMDQLAVSQQEGDFLESIVNGGPQQTVGPPERREAVSSLNVEEPAMLPGLRERVQDFRRARQRAQGQGVVAPQESDEAVNVRVPDDDFPDEDSPSSTSGGEKCGVCKS